MISLPTLRGLATILVCLSCLSAAYSVPRARLDPEMHETKNVTTELSRRVTPSNMVFAHFMVGFTANYSVPSWENGTLNSVLASTHLTSYILRHHVSEGQGYRCFCTQFGS